MQYLSTSFFVLLLVSFALPWIQVDCHGEKVGTFSGIELLTGSEISQPAGFGYSQTKKIDPEPLVMGVTVVAVAGLILSLLNKKNIEILAGIFCLLLLIVLMVKINADAEKQGLMVEYLVGFWTAVAMSIGAVVSGVILLNKKKK